MTERFTEAPGKPGALEIQPIPVETNNALEGKTMNDKQAYYFAQSHAFKCGYQDYRNRNVYGTQFSERMSPEWQRGWKWAELNT